MVSEVEICNRALIQCHAAPISSFRPPEDSEESVACAAVYDQLREEVLRSHPWNFAIALDQLNQVSPAPEFDYSFAYQLPADCLRVLKMDRATRHRFNVIGNLLYTNSPSAKVYYIKNVKDTTLFDSLFITALSTRIAAELAYALSGSSERAEQLARNYDKAIREAKRRDGQEGITDDVTADLFIDSRFSGNNGGYSW